MILNNAGGDPAYFATQLQILEGSGLMRRVITTLDLQNNREFINPQANKKLTVWQNVKKMLGFVYSAAGQHDAGHASRSKKQPDTKESHCISTAISPPRRLRPMFRCCRRNLDVSPVTDSRTSSKETRLIDIDYTHLDPVVAAKIANAIGDAYVLQNLENKVRTNASAGDFLQKTRRRTPVGDKAERRAFDELRADKPDNLA